LLAPNAIEEWPLMLALAEGSEPLDPEAIGRDGP